MLKISGSSEKLVALLLFWCTFFPFVSPIVLSSDLQPPVIIMSLISIGLRLLKSQKIKVEILFLLILVFIYLFYINPSLSISNVKFSKSISLSCGILVLIAWNFSFEHMKLRAINKVIYTYFLFSVLFFLKIPLYEFLINKFVFIRNDIYLEGRGAAILSPEPSFFSGVLIGIMCFNEYIKNQLSKKEYLVNVTLIIIMFLINSSGTGFVFLLIFVYFKYTAMFSNKKQILSILCFIIFIIMISSVNLIPIFEFIGVGPRLLDLINKLYQGNIIQSDRSLFVRFFDLTNSLKLFFQYPFGVGIGGEGDALLNFGNEISEYRYHGQKYPGFVSSFANHLLTYGIIFIIPLMIIYRLKINLYSSISILLLMFSFSSAFPIIWMLILLSNRGYRDENI